MICLNDKPYQGFWVRDDKWYCLQNADTLKSLNAQKSLILWINFKTPATMSESVENSISQHDLDEFGHWDGNVILRNS